MSTRNDNYPQRFYCPITVDIMTDPVITPSGNTYERSAITNWLQQHQTEPLTRKIIFPHQLIPNRALKEEIEQALANPNYQAPTTNTNINPVTTTTTVTGTSNSNSTVSPFNNILDLEAVTNNNRTMITIVVPKESDRRTPVRICCVIDISGSMDSEAEIKNKAGEKEKHGLSVLDVVKHATKTIISSLNSNDYFALVVFDDTAEIKLSMTVMTETNKTRALSIVDNLTTRGRTNIWQGLLLGMSTFNDSDYGKNCALILLTDGVPTDSPNRGEANSLKALTESRRVPCTINTFGFGYSLKSDMLQEVAEIGNGTYAYIPDASFVGTVFVNMMANIQRIVATNVHFRVETESTVDEGIVPHVGSGQSRHFVMPNTGFQLAEISYYDPFTQNRQITRITNNHLKVTNDDTMITIQYYRTELVDLIKNIITLGKRGTFNNQAQLLLVNKIESSSVKNDPYMQAVVSELTGQLTKAVSKSEYFNRWGIHYLLSVNQAHRLEQCNNFKDPAVQFYGDDKFRKVRDEIDLIFDQLPAPKPSKSISYSYSSSSSYGFTPSYSSSYRSYTPVSMSTYNSSDTGCIHGDCVVKMHDGSFKKISDIRKNDLVATPSGTGATVLCVVRTDCTGQKVHMSSFGDGLRLTPYHPVRINGEWMFPLDVNPMKEYDCEGIYDFVLDREHIMIVNDIECCTFGHGLTDNDVIKHEYFGSKIIDDLKELDGWNEGYVNLPFNAFQRDPVTTLIVGLKKF